MFLDTLILSLAPQVVINMHKVLVRFGIMHVVATNICCWLVTTVVEANEDFRAISNHELLEKQHQHQQLQPHHQHQQPHVIVQHLELNGISLVLSFLPLSSTPASLPSLPPASLLYLSLSYFFLTPPTLRPSHSTYFFYRSPLISCLCFYFLYLSI